MCHSCGFRSIGQKIRLDVMNQHDLLSLHWRLWTKCKQNFLTWYETNLDFWIGTFDCVVYQLKFNPIFNDKFGPWTKALKLALSWRDETYMAELDQLSAIHFYDTKKSVNRHKGRIELCPESNDITFNISERRLCGFVHVLENVNCAFVTSCFARNTSHYSRKLLLTTSSGSKRR